MLGKIFSLQPKRRIPVLASDPKLLTLSIMCVACQQKPDYGRGSKPFKPGPIIAYSRSHQCGRAKYFQGL